MNDHDVIVALVAFDVLFLLIVVAIVWVLSPLADQYRAEQSARKARHARPKADA